MTFNKKIASFASLRPQFFWAGGLPDAFMGVPAAPRLFSEFFKNLQVQLFPSLRPQFFWAGELPGAFMGVHTAPRLFSGKLF